MADINDVLQGLNLPTPPQTDQAAPPQSSDIMSQLLGGTSYPQQAPQQAAPQQPGGPVDPMQLALQQVKKDLNNPVYRADPATEYRQFINKMYYGNADGSEPTTKQKVLRPVEDMLEGLLGYKRPELKMLPAAQQAYQEQTGRLGSQTGIERLLETIGYQQRGLDVKQQMADAATNRVNVALQENKAKDLSREVRNSIYQAKQLADQQHLNAEDKFMAVRSRVAQYGMDNPSNRYQLIEKLRTSKDPEEVKEALALDAALKEAETPLLTTGSNTGTKVTTDTAGNTVTENSKNNTYTSPSSQFTGPKFLGPNNKIGQILNSIGIPIGGKGGPISNGAPTGAGPTTPPFMPPSKPAIPGIPQTQSQAPQTSPTGPISGIPGMHPIQSNDGDPTDSRFPFKGGTSPKTSADYAADQIARKKRTDQFRSMEFMSASLAQDLMNTIKDGTNNWTGAFNGNPLMQKFRSDFGDISPLEAMGKGDFFNTMMTRARSAVQGAGRMNIPEIKMAGTTTGNQQEQAKNAMLQAADASFKTGVQRLFDQGKISLQDQPVITKAIQAELNRIKNGQTSTVRSIEDVIGDETTKQTIYDKNGNKVTVPARNLKAALESKDESGANKYFQDNPKKQPIAKALEHWVGNTLMLK